MIFSGNVPGDEDLTCFPLDESNTMNLLRAKSKDFYRLLLHKTHTNPPSGPKGWDRYISSEKITWRKIFRSIRETCQENKLREFHFKFIQRIIVTRKELFRFKIKEDSDCIYRGEADSIDQCFSLRKCCNGLMQLTIPRSILLLKKFYLVFQLQPMLIKKKLRYALLFLRYYIYKRKLQNNNISYK